jgi:phosphatidylglycerophosphatase A
MHPSIGPSELALIFALVLILLVTRRIIFGAVQPKRSPDVEPFNVVLWIAQGFGVGRIPFGPGTFGSLIGVVWFGLLLGTRNIWLFVGGTGAGLALSVWLCGAAEKILGQKDPGSVVLDEIVALPVCFFAWVLLLFRKTGSLPVFEDFVSGKNLLFGLAVFVAFRFFDVTKPWPVRQSQALPGGWGITIDDVLAALYVNLVTLLVYGGRVLYAVATTMMSVEE